MFNISASRSGYSRLENEKDKVDEIQSLASQKLFITSKKTLFWLVMLSLSLTNISIWFISKYFALNGGLRGYGVSTPYGMRGH